MNRRAFLSGPVLVGFTGCTTTDDEQSNDSESPSADIDESSDEHSKREEEESQPAITTLDEFSDLNHWNTIEATLSATPEHRTGSQAAHIEIEPADAREEFSANSPIRLISQKINLEWYCAPIQRSLSYFKQLMRVDRTLILEH